MIKLPSVQTILSQVLATVKRFPLTILCAVIGTGILIHLTRFDWNDYYTSQYNLFFWAKLAMCTELGLCVFLAVALYTESRNSGVAQKIVLNAVALILIGAYYFSIRHYERFESMGFTRYTLYVIASHLMVAFAAFTGKGSINGFWQFNRALFLRFLLSFLYTIVLYGGICIGMVLLDQLLHVNIHSHYYAYAWFCMMGVFNTTFFLAGVPANITELDADTTYLKGLKAFTQFVLLPLVTMYLLILYAYMVRILLNGNLPKGYVSYLVISFSGMGILSLLLIYPIRHLEDNKWISTFAKWFYKALYPLIVLLGFSIYHRVHQYGITPDRYFIVLLAIWLACIAAYFLFSKKENIKLIPISLCTIALLSSFGPWGVFSVSNNSQMHQLEKLLTDHKALKDGKLNKDSIKTIPDSVSRRAESIVRYLVGADATDKLQPWIKQNLDSLSDSNSYSRYSYLSYEESETIMAFMGFSNYSVHQNDYYNGANNGLATISYYITYESGTAVNNMEVRGYDYVSDVNQYNNNHDAINADTTWNDISFSAGNDNFTMIPYKSPAKYGIVLQGKTVAVLELEDSLLSWKKLEDTTTHNNYVSLPSHLATIAAMGNEFDFKLRIRNLSAYTKNGKLYIYTMNADVLTRKHMVEIQ